MLSIVNKELLELIWSKHRAFVFNLGFMEINEAKHPNDAILAT